jgi:EAL domain-containing protein (putative c-di-GMP-specific phosphodiesterase class I)
MTVKHLQRSVLLLFVAVLADSLVAAVLRVGSIQAFLNGDRSWTNLVALGGLGCLALLLVVTLLTVRDLLGLWHQLTSAQSRIAVLEASAMMSRAQAPGSASTVRDLERDIVASRQRLLDVLERGNLTIAMQPIIDIKQDRCVSAEALSRFPDGREPEVWFRKAEEMGLGVELELLAMTRALARVPELPPDIGISINASPSLILDPRMSEVIHRSGIALDRLTLEITEQAALTAYDDINGSLMVLRERGVLLAVDDTGAGHASFGHVLKLRPDIIKLDRSIIVNIANNPAKRAFVTAVVLLALELDSSITAEGVETRDELDTVVALGVNNAQGHFLARPQTSAAIWRSWTGRRWLAPTDRQPAELHLDT